MFKRMINKANDYTKNTIISSVTDVQTSVSKYAKETSKDSDDIFNKYWPIIEKLLLSSLIGVAEKGLKSDDSLEVAFSTAYEVMPTPLRLIISKDKFIEFCMGKKELILKSLLKYKEENKNNKINIDKNTSISTEKDTHISMYDNLIP